MVISTGLHSSSLNTENRSGKYHSSNDISSQIQDIQDKISKIMERMSKGESLSKIVRRAKRIARSTDDAL